MSRLVLHSRVRALLQSEPTGLQAGLHPLDPALVGGLQSVHTPGVLPAGHAVHRPPMPAIDSPQSLHLVGGCAGVLPSSHAVHTPSVSQVALTPVQTVQPSPPAFGLLPAAHVKHEELPQLSAPSLYFPLAQLMHLSLEWCCPAGHLPHPFPFKDTNPAAHFVHVVRSGFAS
jgi:hypothetical protein